MVVKREIVAGDQIDAGLLLQPQWLWRMARPASTVGKADL